MIWLKGYSLPHRNVFGEETNIFISAELNILVYPFAIKTAAKVHIFFLIRKKYLYFFIHHD